MLMKKIMLIFFTYMRDFLREKKSDRSYTEVFAKACESEISKVRS